MAHPHAWIDLRSQVLLDEKGHIRALQMEWMFDDFYTVAIAEDVDSNARQSDTFWQDLARRNLTNLAEHGYFTVIKADGEPVALGEVANYQGELRDKRMWMHFEVPLNEPIDPKAHDVTFAVFDPTYYVEIVHLEGDVISFEGVGADTCAGDIIQPAPTFEQVSLAAALDQDETAGDGLGELFAETVVVRCS